MKTTGKALVLGMLVTLTGVASGHVGPGEQLSLTDKNFMELSAAVMAKQGRPNELERIHGLKSYARGDYRDAVEHFEKAAQYADKYSQHYLSLMHWHGAGVEADPVKAYIWADLAAERGNRTMLLIREKMWSQLTAQEQQRAVDAGGAYYARYGDDVAKPHVENLMRSFARDMTGSRIGYRNEMLEIAGAPINRVFFTEIGANAAAYAAAEAVEPRQLYGMEGGVKFDTYWKEQDALMGVGNVDIGPVTPARKK